MGKSPFTMPGSSFYGKGNQSVSPGKYTGHWNDPRMEAGTGTEGEVPKASGQATIQAPLAYTGHWNDPRMDAGTGVEGEVLHASGQSTVQAPLSMKGSPTKDMEKWLFESEREQVKEHNDKHRKGLVDDDHKPIPQKKDDDESSALTMKGSPAKHPEGPHHPAHEKKDTSGSETAKKWKTRKGFGGNIDWSAYNE